MAATATPETASPTPGSLPPGAVSSDAVSPDETLLHAATASNYAALDNAKFRVVSDFAPAGDQPEAVAALSKAIDEGERFQTLRGITGSGKSATMAWTIEQTQRPTLILAPNKSLAAQLAQEMREFFPDNRVEYFVSYYDYYQPEAYIPSSDTFIEKDSSINDEIDRLRHSATAALLTRRDVIVVASVSCIYGMGNPEEYRGNLLDLSVGVDYDMRNILRRLVDMQYGRNDMTLGRGNFRVRGDTIEVHPSYEESVLRIEMFGDTIDRITTIDPLTGEQLSELQRAHVFPATHYVTGPERLRTAMAGIEVELQERLKWFEENDKLLEAQRLRMRTQYDLEMMSEVGFCNGIENYSRHIDGRQQGTAPHTLLDYFPEDFLLVIDESHVTVPQIGAMYEGDSSRKRTLVEREACGQRAPTVAQRIDAQCQVGIDEPRIRGAHGIALFEYRDQIAGLRQQAAFARHEQQMRHARVHAECGHRDAVICESARIVECAERGEQRPRLREGGRRRRVEPRQFSRVGDAGAGKVQRERCEVCIQDLRRAVGAQRAVVMLVPAADAVPGRHAACATAALVCAGARDAHRLEARHARARGVAGHA